MVQTGIGFGRAVAPRTTLDVNGATAVARTTVDVNSNAGTSTNPSSSALTNAGAIGYQARVSTSNSLVLGGTGANAVNVGIGTTAPASTLDVVGSVAYPFVITSTGSITLDGTHHTIRRLAACTTITLPDATTVPGREYVIINTSATTLSLVTYSGSQSVYDVNGKTEIGNSTASHGLAPAGPVAFTIQSDGSHWCITHK